MQKKLEEGPLTACLNVEMCQSIVSSTMPVARIQGRSDKYVLVSGHYDSWYEGITDNGVANAAMMEIARVFQENQEHLERSVVLAGPVIQMPVIPDRPGIMITIGKI